MSAAKKPKTKSSKLAAAGSDPDAEVNPELDAILSQDCIAEIERCVTLALERHEESLLGGMVERLHNAGFGERPVAQTGMQGSSGWLPIESLSALRSLVGGRFHNLKERWIEAGFPLKEHRGDKPQKFEVNQQGWIELSNWILKQGFEARLALESGDCLFELRALERV